MIEINNPKELEELQETQKNILLVVYGINCQPCDTLKRSLIDLESSYPSTTFTQFNGKENRDWCIEQGIRKVPTIKVYQQDSSETTIAYKEHQPTLDSLVQLLKRIEQEENNE